MGQLGSSGLWDLGSGQALKEVLVGSTHGGIQKGANSVWLPEVTSRCAASTGDQQGGLPQMKKSRKLSSP